MYTEYFSFKNPFMSNNDNYASRLVRIKLKGRSGEIEGNMIFSSPGENNWVTYGEYSSVKFRCKDAHQTEMVVNLRDVDMINYL